MDPPAPPPDQVRPTQVIGGEIPTLQKLQQLKQSPSKGIKKTQQNAILKQRKDGSVRLIYSTKTDINYINYEDRQKLQPVPEEFDMFGLTNQLCVCVRIHVLTCGAMVRITYNNQGSKWQRQSTEA